MEQQLISTSNKQDARKLLNELRQIHVLSELSEADAACMGEVEIVKASKGTQLYDPGDQISGFWAVLEGEIRGFKRDDDGSRSFLMSFSRGDSFGEVPLLAGRRASVVSCEVVADTTLLGIGEEGFWRLMASCPRVRAAILANMDKRLQSYQAFTVHREKLMSLGVLAAGLMHELNNPGAAAKRAASQLRENLMKLQQISLRFTTEELNPVQVECMRELQERAFNGEKPKVMSTLDQSDAEERLCEWLDSAGVENSWKLAPTLTAIGITAGELECTHKAFHGTQLSDALNWLDSLVSSVQLVGAIEESITRVTELVAAVKRYSYDDKHAQTRKIDVHEGLQTTLTILNHKLRPKELSIHKQFSPGLPLLETRGTGLTQVWTNLLDNAIDASPQRGTIHIRTWLEGDTVFVGIADEGAGIPEEIQSRIFEAFFTTKPVGVGTGLGLDIAQRIVVGSYGGNISFTTRPGRTEFVVALPVGAPH